MKLQLALDMIGLDEAMSILSDLQHVIDIVEVGTPWIIRDGLHPVTKIKERIEGMSVLADLKIMDAGKHEAADAFAAGADIVTVMAVTHDATIRGALEAAEKHGGEIMTDLLAVVDQETRSKEMVGLGVHYVCVHTAFDIQASGKDPLEELGVAARAIGGNRVAVAGGINIGTLPAVLEQRPAIIIVGGSLTNLRGKDLIDATEKMKGMINNV